MADDQLLSQTDIDSLLQSLGAENSQPGGGGGDSGGTSGQKYKIKMYDFKRQTRFAKDQLRTLQHIHDTFTRQIATFFFYIVKISCQYENSFTGSDYL